MLAGKIIIRFAICTVKQARSILRELRAVLMKSSAESNVYLKKCSRLGETPGIDRNIISAWDVR
jgi:hypothetical protein